MTGTEKKTLHEEWAEYKKERNQRLHRFFVRVMVIFAVLGLTMSATVYYVYTSSQANTDALCSVRHDAERRVALGNDFIKDHPNGIPGISGEALKVSVRNSQETVDSLSSLDCDPEPMPTATP